LEFFLNQWSITMFEAIASFFRIINKFFQGTERAMDAYASSMDMLVSKIEEEMEPKPSSDSNSKPTTQDNPE
jgi:hypothetical protein